jgi:signal transduction histidine kinase
MVASTIIFAPALMRYRYLQIAGQLSIAQTAALAAEVAPDNALTLADQVKILNHIDAHRIDVRWPDGRALSLAEPEFPAPGITYDLPDGITAGLFVDTFASLLRVGEGTVRLHGPSPQDADAVVDVVIDESILDRQLRTFAARMSFFTMLISITVATMVFVVLRTLILAPLKRLTVSMVAFRNRPEDPGRTIAVSGRQDEIGVAERELAAMQSVLRSTLGQHGRLAALGEAVSKINHDLRGILSTARLVSDRLAESDDPIVKKSLPPLLSALDRAVRLCKRTLDFSAAEPVLKRMRFPFKLFVDEVAIAVVPAAGPGFVLINDVPLDVFVYADRDQFFRAFSNLIGNAIEAKARRFSIAAHRNEDDGLVITVADDGTGIPDTVRANLFQPFAGRSRVGGTGLGLAIVREVIRGHGGTIALTSTGPLGTVFEIVLPPSAVTSAPRVRAARRWGGLRTIDGHLSDGQKSTGRATERPDR